MLDKEAGSAHSLYYALCIMMTIPRVICLRNYADIISDSFLPKTYTEELQMDLTIGAYKNELSSVYRDVINKPLHVEHADISKEQYNASKVVFSNEINDNLPKGNLLKGNLPKRVNYTEAIETGARNLTDYLEIEDLGVKYSINVMDIMLRTTSNYQERSLFDIAKLYDDEYNRVKGLTDITERDREARLHVLDEAFVKASRLASSHLTATGGNIGRNFETLVEFTQNVFNNIQASGLSEKTQRLMIQSMDKALNFYKNKLITEAVHKAVEQHPIKKSWKLSPQEITEEINKKIKSVIAEQHNIYNHYWDKIKVKFNNPLNQLMWAPTAVSNGNVKDEEAVNEDTSSEVSSSEGASEETVDGETTSEVSNSEGSSEETVNAETSSEVSNSEGSSEETVNAETSSEVSNTESPSGEIIGEEISSENFAETQ